ncbi:MAG: type II toxin-antitoxin system RelE/ParE family toxin [Byssovorax sp.]
MKLAIVWHPAAENQLGALGWHPAESIDAAVIRFAETQRGDVEWVAPYYRLRIGRYLVRFTIEAETGTMNVLFVYRAR